MYITYEIKSWLHYVDNSFALRNYLFEAVKLTKNVDIDKYSCSGYGVSFDVSEAFSLSNGGIGKNIIFVAWALLCMLIIKKYMIILGKVLAQGWDDTVLSAEIEYSINFAGKGV